MEAGISPTESAMIHSFHGRINVNLLSLGLLRRGIGVNAALSRVDVNVRSACVVQPSYIIFSRQKAHLSSFPSQAWQIPSYALPYLVAWV